MGSELCSTEISEVISGSNAAFRKHCFDRLRARIASVGMTKSGRPADQEAAGKIYERNHPKIAVDRIAIYSGDYWRGNYASSSRMYCEQDDAGDFKALESLCYSEKTQDRNSRNNIYLASNNDSFRVHRSTIGLDHEKTAAAVRERFRDNFRSLARNFSRQEPSISLRGFQFHNVPGLPSPEDAARAIEHPVLTTAFGKRLSCLLEKASLRLLEFFYRHNVSVPSNPTSRPQLNGCSRGEEG